MGGSGVALYMEREDLTSLVARIDWDPELAWIEPQAGGRWIASRILDAKPEWHMCIWHIPGGRLPMVVPSPRPGLPRRVEQRGWIEDPFAGWEDPFRGRFEAPRFGDPTCVYWLKLCVRDGPGSRPGQAEVGISWISWIGRHYGVIGRVPADSTSRNWGRLQKWVKSNAVRVQPQGVLEVDKPSRLDAFAFPAALAAIRSGSPRMVNFPPQP